MYRASERPGSHHHEGTGRGVRLSLLVASLLAGLLIAVLTVHLAAPWHVASFH